MATDLVTRIDSPSMAAILLDVDGVLHVSGEPIPGAAEAVERLREAGHRLRFVTNSTTRPRAELAAELRAMGIELARRRAADDGRLRRPPARRPPRPRADDAAIVPDLDGIELVGEGADAVLIGGADEAPENNRVFSYMNLARAFAELDAGAELYALHKNRWWQTQRGPLLDSGAIVAGLEYAAGVEATVIGKPTAAYFDAALAALDAEPTLTWMVGDDYEADLVGARACGLRTILVRTGKFRPDAVERFGIMPDGICSSIADVPEWIERELRSDASAST